MFLALLLAAATAAAPLPPISPAAQPRGSSALAPDAESRWVPFDLTPGNQLRFSVEIDGRAATAILDTGVSYSVLSRRFAERAALKVTSGGSATAIGGIVSIGWTATRKVSFGSLTRQGGGLAVATLPALATGSAEPVDLLVGRDLIEKFALDLDYAGRRFRLLPSGRMPFRGFTAPLTISRDRLVYVSALSLGAAHLQPMIVDTGDGSSVTVTDAGWTAAKIAGVRTTTTISFGLGGTVTSTIGIVPTLRLGELTARNVEVRVEPAGGFSETIQSAGRIGSGFLQNYRVLLDPAARRMILAPGATADRPPLRSTSGLLVGIDRDRLRVLHVMRGGPAERDGWSAGETICAIDGQPIPRDYATNPLATWSAGTPGRMVRLRLCDGPERQLTLQHFY
ncbi:Aspartyl protease [Sphingomonas sp. OV641]|uniref:aspartyl protease family protein n=1 Tax=Sphingomonas sp. OV641 TaxID=1881068 RepID=UPI0008BBF527|nr:aspartyl protease family protein [Sphingomonas sp. OV641]SEJ27125.1 Aspartyl protease [Sphingomonas sp. OV641]